LRSHYRDAGPGQPALSLLTFFSSVIILLFFRFFRDAKGTGTYPAPLD
jgi:hypothetical protein